MLKVLFPMKCYHRHLIFIQIQKSGSSANQRLHLRFLTVCNNPLKAFIYIIRHRNLPYTCFRLGFLNDILHISFSLKLMVYIDFAILEINISYR